MVHAYAHIIMQIKKCFKYDIFKIAAKGIV